MDSTQLISNSLNKRNHRLKVTRQCRKRWPTDSVLLLQREHHWGQRQDLGLLWIMSHVLTFPWLTIQAKLSLLGGFSIIWSMWILTKLYFISLFQYKFSSLNWNYFFDCQPSKNLRLAISKVDENHEISSLIRFHLVQFHGNSLCQLDPVLTCEPKFSDWYCVVINIWTFVNDSLHQVHVRWRLDSNDENSCTIDIKVGKFLNLPSGFDPH